MKISKTFVIKSDADTVKSDISRFLRNQYTDYFDEKTNSFYPAYAYKTYGCESLEIAHRNLSVTVTSNPQNTKVTVSYTPDTYWTKRPYCTMFDNVLVMLEQIKDHYDRSI